MPGKGVARQGFSAVSVRHWPRRFFCCTLMTSWPGCKAGISRAIRDEIISTWLFADPKDCCNDTCFPWIPLRRSGGGRFSDEGLAFSSDRFGLSSKGWIICDEESETKKAK